MTQKKYDLIYLNEHFAKYVKVDRIITIILAIASNSSIATWAIWQKWDFVWAAIIAGSQLLVVINNNLPYKKRIKELSEVSSKLLPIYNKIEYSWLYVSDGQLNEQEINALLYECRIAWTNVENQYFCFDSLPQKERLIKKAELKKSQYFVNNF